jgi:hypothetical protein
MNYENGPKEPNQEWMQFAEAYAAYSGSQEPDWHAFYTDSETRRFAAEEKILALEKQLDSGSQPTAPEPHAANNWRMWNEMLMIAQEHARTALNKLGQTEEQIVSLTEQIKAKDEHSEELQKYVVSLTQERDNWKMKCEQLQFAVKHYSGPTTEGAVRRQFQRLHPCPSTQKRSGSCPGYVVDHVIPLACGGADSVLNLQWQTVKAAKLKDKWERKGCPKEQNLECDTNRTKDGHCK